MKKDERKKRLEDLLKLQKQKEIMQERLQEEKMVREAFEEAIGDELEFEVLSFDETELIIKDFTNTFPIAFWNRIEWTNKSVKHQAVNSGEISSIPLILNKKGFSTSSPIYVFWGMGNYPCIRTTLEAVLLEKFDEIIWVGSDMDYYCPIQKYVIEFFHDGSINIGWVNK
ncbi:CDI toxin immunity protein [Neobacillus drentensis]|uniref:CDI toxin immunity protein n=1 Tax=Neobacillus drentensis TaxID=220684 RepID=UPI0030016242